MTSERSPAAVGEEVRKEHGFDPAASAGLFVGVSAFAYGRIPDVPYAVDDAVDLAHLFALELELLRPDRAVLALAGEPKKPGSAERLAKLLALGAQRVPAGRSDLYLHLETAARASGPAGLFLLAVASHGLSEQGADFILTADSLPNRQVTTGLAVSDLFFETSQAGAPRRLVLLDACRDNLLGVLRRGPRVGMAQSFVDAIGRAEGQVVISATTLGGFSYDDERQENGAFTAAVLAGLRGAAPADERGFITARTLAGFLQDRMVAWVRRHAPEDAAWAKGVETRFSGPGESLPLAENPERRRAVGVYRVRREAAVALLKQKAGGILRYGVVDQVLELLPAAGPAADCERLLGMLEALARGGESAQWGLRGFLEHLRGEATKADTSPPSPARTPSPAPPASSPSPSASAPLPAPSPPAAATAGALPPPPPRHPERSEGSGRGERTLPGSGAAPLLVAPRSSRLREGGRFKKVVSVVSTVAAVAGLGVLGWLLAQRPEEPILVADSTDMFDEVQSGSTQVPALVEPAASAGTIIEGPLGMRFRFVPADTYWIGSPEGEPGRDDDEIRHQLRLTRGFWIGETEVTQGQWSQLLKAGEQNPSKFRVCGDDCPVETVSWFEAAEFANRLSDREGLGRCYRLECTGPLGTESFTCSSATFVGLDCPGYRLPTEAEWEVAARAGTETAIYTGGLTMPDGPELEPIAWYEKNSGGTTHPVGRKDPNDWGLRDALGNVWEWVGDWGIEPYGGGLGIDPIGPGMGSLRVVRGGSWFYDAGYVRAAARYALGPGHRLDDLGFRLARGQGRSSQ